VQASVSKTCLVRFDNNKYSVAASAVGRPVEVHAYADRIVIRQDGRIVGEHPRSFGRGDTVYDPWHYVPVLARKPGALRNGAPFKDWVLPAAMERVRRLVERHRAFVPFQQSADLLVTRRYRISVFRHQSYLRHLAGIRRCPSGTSSCAGTAAALRRQAVVPGNTNV
jgi:hypothetical protein